LKESNAGNKRSVVTISEPIQMVRSFPMLAIPRWGEKERVLKLKIVVSILKKRPLAVLVLSILLVVGGSVLKR
jgi:hypothetical protein